MSARDLFMDFLNYVFLLVLIAFCVFYFTIGDRVQAVSNIMQAMVPFAFLGVVFLIRLKILRLNFKKRKTENNTGIVLYLTCFDKMKDEIIIFLLPAIILLLAVYRGKLDILDLIQAFTVFVIVFIWHQILFKKTN